MQTSNISRLLMLVTCAALSACGGGSGAATDTFATSTGMMASASMSTITSSPEPTTAPAGWITCATENNICSVSGQAQVRYGTMTDFVIRTVNGPIICSNAVFGDPAVGQVKSCSIDLASVSWTVCATEGAICPVIGSTAVRYGTDTKYVTKIATGPVACTNATFSDPAPDVVKSCKIDAKVMAAIQSASWMQCAAEGKTCAVAGTFEVRYGTANAFVTKTLTGPFACSNVLFGDPAPNQVKTCTIAVTQGINLPAPLVTNPAPVDVSTPVPTPAPTPVAGAITTVQLINPISTAQTNVAATFGQSFVQGDVPKGSTLIGKLGNGTLVALQVDAKARHADGSLRHAVITAQLPALAAKQVETVGLLRESTASAVSQTSPTALLGSGFSASFNATIGGVRYSAAADELLKSGKFTTWLAGPLANEWMVAAPLKTASGVEHPHLHARFAIRSYPATNSARVDVTIENGWAYTTMPSNFTYDAEVVVGGQPVFSQAALNHYSHARWRKVFWWGNAPKVDVRHSTAYLIASKAVPNYDQSLVIRENTLSTWAAHWASGKTGPMQAGLAVPYMPTTGARAEIGPMPTWSALYLLSMDQRMKNLTLGMSEVAGSWGVHYRNQQTGRPVTLAEFPYMSLVVGGIHTLNPATGKMEAFPDCPQTRCATPMTVDNAHQPAFSYVPYLLTGDYFHLEELQFWANMNSFNSVPNERYRDAGKGLVKGDQVRGQAWSLRTLAEAAYITPDDDPQKLNFTTIVNNNIDWYTNTFPSNPNANKLGVLDHYDHVGYLDGLGIAPWQDDFFTAMVGRMVELGFSNAQPLLAWKSKFVVDRMVGNGYCWIQASQYAVKVRASTTAPLYTTIEQVYLANNTLAFTQLACGSTEMATSLGMRVGQMAGEFTPSGTQAIMQPALAYSAGLNATAAKAWAQFAGRPDKPDMASEPQYAIVPR